MTEANYGKTFNNLPSPEHYDMWKKTLDYDAFLKWLEENYNTKFALAVLVDEYCTHDVKILVYALITYRDRILVVTRLSGRGMGIDILQ